MAQGLWIRDARNRPPRRPTTKKEVREFITKYPTMVRVERTSVFSDEYDGDLIFLPEGVEVLFAGPDPHTNRRFFGTITREGKEEFKLK